MALRFPRLQFSLRTLVILVVIVAALASWHGSRYARVQARVAARAELAKYGIELIEGEENIHEREAKASNSLVQKWDEYWFGQDALREYGFVFIEDKTFFPAFERNPQIHFQDRLALFPEVDSVYVGAKSAFEDELVGTLEKPYEGRLLPRDLLLAMLSLPRVKHLQIHRRGEIEHDVASVLPQDSLLETLHLSEVAVTPRALETILVHAPRLQKLIIGQHALDAAIVADLNRSGWPRPSVVVNKEEPYAAYLQIEILDPRNDPRETLEPSLVNLSVPYHLAIQAIPRSVMDPQSPLVELAGYAATRLYCNNTGNLAIKNFPNLKYVTLKHTQEVQLRDCPLVERVYIDEVRKLTLHGLQNLSLANSYKCDEVVIHDCATIEKLWFEKTTIARVSQLPKLEQVIFQGDSLVLHNVPQLDSVELDNPTVKQLQDLRKHLKLKYLTLNFTKPLERLPSTALSLLQELPALEQLGISGRNCVADDDEQVFLGSLGQISRLKLLWIENHPEFPQLLAQNSDANFLPAKLEVLLTDAPFQSAEERNAALRRYPELVCVVTTEPLRKKLDMYRGYLKDLPPKAELAPYAERIDP